MKKARLSTSPIRTAINTSSGRRCVCPQAPWRSPPIRESGASATRFMARAILHELPAFFEKYCGMEVERNSQTAEGTLILRMRGGSRFIYKLVDQVDERIAGHSPWWDMHTALLVREEEFFPTTGVCGKGFPKRQGPRKTSTIPGKKKTRFQRARVCTAVRRDTSGKRSIRRGDEFYDWDGHAFHFFGGIPLKNDGSLALYEGKEQEEYLRELKESLKKGA